MPLEYPVTRPYTLPHLTLYVSVVSVVVIVGLVALNFVLQGYEVTTVLRSDPNITDSYWWKPRGIPGWESTSTCDPVSLSGHSSFRTNSSMFSYEIRGVFDSSGQSIMGAASYMANSLSECEVEGVMFIGEPSRNRIEFNTLVRCTGPSIPFSLSLFSPFFISSNPFHDDFNIYYTRNKPAWSVLEPVMKPNSLPLNASALTNVIGVVDALTSDFAVATMLEIRRSNESLPTKITSGILFTCPDGQNTICKYEDRRMTIPAFEIVYANGTINGDFGPGPFFSPVKQSMINVLVAVRDAYHIDLGNIRHSNTLLNKAAFDSTMKPDKRFLAGLQSASPPQNMMCPVGFGCSVGTPWVQRLLSSDPGINITIPTILPTGSAPAVIKLDYLCPSYRLKSPGSLVASLFIGTWSMYMALFGGFRVVGPMLERRYGRGDADNNKDDLESHLSDSDLQEYKNSIRNAVTEPESRMRAHGESSPLAKAWS